MSFLRRIYKKDNYMERLRGFNTSLQEVEEEYQWINDMISSRQKLMVAYMKLVHTPSSGSSMELAPSELTELTTFCEDVIDYVSHGHFDLYPKIITLIEKATGRSVSIAHRVLPRIEKTTDFLMRFCDHYTEDSRDDVSSLKDDLAALGRCLEQRFKNEDRLIIGLRLINRMRTQEGS